MKTSTTLGSQAPDASAFVGILAGIGMLLSAFLVADMHLLAVPAFAVLVPSLLYELR